MNRNGTTSDLTVDQFLVQFIEHRTHDIYKEAARYLTSLQLATLVSGIKSRVRDWTLSKDDRNDLAHRMFEEGMSVVEICELTTLRNSRLYEMRRKHFLPRSEGTASRLRRIEQEGEA